MDYQPFKHRIHYYETDKMGITHHSNYIRWMEEARCDFLKQMGWPFTRWEELGIVSPVVSVDCRYRKSTTFDQEISIRVAVEAYTGIRLQVSYEMQDASGNTVCTGSSGHCFLNAEGRPVKLDRYCPELDRAFREILEETEAVSSAEKAGDRHE